MSGETHELYKELSTAINDLAKDLLTGLVSLRAVAGDNKADIERIEHRFDKGFKDLQDKVDRLTRAEGATEVKVAAVESRVEKLENAAERRSATDGAVQVESTKGRWLFWVAIAGGGLGLLTTVVQIVANALGWGSR